MFPYPISEDFNVARDNLRPALMARTRLASLHLQVRIVDGDPNDFDPPLFEIGGHLFATLSYEVNGMGRTIDNRHLSHWGTTCYEAMEIARVNLNAAGFKFRKIGNGLYSSAMNDGYDSCCLLEPSLFEQFDVKGDLVAMVPDRNTVLVCGIDDHQSLQRAVTIANNVIAKSAGKEKFPHSPFPLRLDGDEWVDWPPITDHLLLKGFRNLANRYFEQEYGVQTGLLEQLHEKNGTDIRVAEFRSVDAGDEKIVSVADWSTGRETLLPKADLICFAHADVTRKIDAIATWQRVEQVVGHLMQLTDFYPVRYRIMDYPTAAELSELGMFRDC